MGTRVDFIDRSHRIVKRGNQCRSRLDRSHVEITSPILVRDANAGRIG